MTEEEMRFALLLHELQSIQQGIRAMETATFAIKGWCVTVAAALVGIALSQNQISILSAALIAIITFWLLDAHFKSLARATSSEISISKLNLRHIPCWMFLRLAPH